MFLGTHYPRLDDKGRLTLPAKFRDALAGGLMVTKGQDHCLYVFPRAEFEQMQAPSVGGVIVPRGDGTTKIRVRQGASMTSTRPWRAAPIGTNLQSRYPDPPRLLGTGPGPRARYGRWMSASRWACGADAPGAAAA
mgnify:CR=1 FL=1